MRATRIHSEVIFDVDLCASGLQREPKIVRMSRKWCQVDSATQAHPHWITPDDLWRDRLTVLAEQNAWLAAWGPRPGEPDCRVPPALLPESQTRRENAYLLWRSTVRVSTHDDDRSRTTPKPRSRRRNDAEQPAPARPRTRRSKSPIPELEPGGSPN